MFTLMVDFELEPGVVSYPLRTARQLAEAIAWDERCTVSVLNEAGNVVYEVAAF